MSNSLPCHLIRSPTGSYIFVGRVPTDLAFASSDPAYIEAATQSGPGIAARIAKAQGGTFRSLSWATEAEAYAAAAALGYAVPQSLECDAAIAAIEAGLVASGAIDAPAMVPQQVQQQQARHTATPDVSSRYGAPMGRRSATFANLDPAERMSLTRIRLNSGGYDAGGAYWGMGAPLWCAMDHTGETAFFRARDREAAKAHVIDNHDTPESVRFYR